MAIRIITHSAFHSPLFKKINNLIIFLLMEYYASIFAQELNSKFSNVFQLNRIMSYSYHAYEKRNNISIRTVFILHISNNSILYHGI